MPETLTLEVWRYRQQAGPMKAHLWLHSTETRCGRYGVPPVGGTYKVKNEERCRICLQISLILLREGAKA